MALRQLIPEYGAINKFELAIGKQHPLSFSLVMERTLFGTLDRLIVF